MVSKIFISNIVFTLWGKNDWTAKNIFCQKDSFIVTLHGDNVANKVSNTDTIEIKRNLNKMNAHICKYPETYKFEGLAWMYEHKSCKLYAIMEKGRAWID